MKILKILAACLAVLVLSSFFVFELIFARSVDNSLSAYAEENITSDFVEPLAGNDPDPSIIDYHWELSGFEQYNLNLLYVPSVLTSTVNGLTYSVVNGSLTINGTSTNQLVLDLTGALNIRGVCSFTVFGTNASGNIGVYFQDNLDNYSNDIYINPASPQVKTYTFNSYSRTFIIIPQNTVCNNTIISPMLVAGTYTVDTMPPYQINLKYIFTTGFTKGYRDGYDTGYDSGRNYGYNLGYKSGYDTGYSYGRNSQISEGLFKNPLDVFLQPISNFLNTDIFGSFSIGDGFTIAFFVMIALIFIKMFAGG